LPRKFFRKYLPDPDEVLAKPWAAPFRPWLGHPNLWHLNRHSVPKAVAIGLFCGLIPGPFQMLGALLMAIPLRSNVPVAMFVTFYTNPLTIVPLYLIAYRIGTLFVPGDSASFIHPPEFDWSNLGAWLRASLEWMLSLGKPLAAGLVILAIGLAIAGYVVVQLAWRAHVVLAWRRRKARRAGMGSG